MKLKQFESYLSGVKRFENPKIELEQYNTSPHLASRMVYTAETSYGDIEGKQVADFGCGTGMLAIAAAIMGSEHTVGFEMDLDAINIARSNIELLGLEDDIDIVRCDVRQLPVRIGSGLCRGSTTDQEEGEKGSDEQNDIGSQYIAERANQLVTSQHEQSEVEEEEEEEGEQVGSGGRAWHPPFDTALMNPPFGTRQKGVDMLFLQAGLSVVRSGGVVYSLHKSSTRKYISKACARWGNVESVEVLAELKFDLPKLYKFHKKKSKDVRVDLIRLTKK